MSTDEYNGQTNKAAYRQLAPSGPRTLLRLVHCHQNPPLSVEHLKLASHLTLPTQLISVCPANSTKHPVILLNSSNNLSVFQPTLSLPYVS